ncbi:MAG TPA: AraC family transcriptional regulator [Rhizomicrobium sp.]|nr:AraC family transcriptional regulator [Rhizomicrobium sp.]
MTTRMEVCVRRYAPHQVMPAHSHAESLMSIVVRGGFRETIGKRERLYSHGHITFFPAGRTHAQDFGPAGARQVIFQPQQDWLAYLKDCGTELESAPYTTGPEFSLFGDRLLQEIENDDPLSGLARQGILLEIVAAFGREELHKNPSSRVPPWLLKAREFLHDNACRATTLGEVARAAGRHETHVAREFRRYFGTSVVGFMRRLRIRRAAQLLAEGGREISAVAFDCGFSSHSHLSREFKLFYGVTPSAYRSMSNK